MRARSAAAAVALAAALLAGDRVAGQRTVFRSSVGTVAVYPLVTDAQGRFATGLQRADFEVLDDGQPVEIAVFSPSQPITATLLLDMSGSMEGRVLRVREAAGRFVEILDPDDRLQIGTFGSEIAISPHLTGDKTTLLRILREELWPGGATPLWLALDAAMTALQGEGGRRAIVLLTDGLDTSGTDEGRIVDRIGRESFIVYGIGVDGVTLDKPLIEAIADSGGAHATLRPNEDLTAAFARIADELRHQYAIGFNPARADGKRHKLEIRVKRPGYAVRAPKQFQAPDK
jgi:Ca-activated chloride channel homolog